MRVKRGKAHLKRRKHLLKRVKGFKWGRKSKIKLAKAAIFKAGEHAFADRRKKKREFRTLWQIKINAACREKGINYSQFIHQLKKNKIELNRKILADLAENQPEIFNKILEETKSIN